MTMTPDTLTQLLNELAEWLEFENCTPVHWIVCGGMALALQGLQVRTTRDVDVLAAWNHTDLEIVHIEEFPDDVNRALRHVVKAHPELAGLNEQWVNLGPRQLASWGLPPGFHDRLTSISFRQTLTLHLLGREDLLALKLYAAADDLSQRQDIHLHDLKALNPTFKELDNAADWIRTLPDFEEKRSELKDAIRELGHEDLAYYI